MDADEVTTKVVLARERPSAGLVRATEWLRAVRIVRRHVGFEIVGSGEGTWAGRALILATAVAVCLATRRRSAPSVAHGGD